MSTRTGSIDPGVLIGLQREEGLSVDTLEDLVYRRSGLLGLSGLSGDMQTLLESKEPQAAEAIESYCYWAARHAASLVGALGGLDALVFTGGVGENAKLIREKIVGHLDWLGLRLNYNYNNSFAKISAADSKVAIYVLRADEESVIARHTEHILSRNAKQLTQN
jgi:acetate kinase